MPGAAVARRFGLGEATGVDETTTEVVLECAWFDPKRIAESGRALSILSDARYRFERTVDPETVLPGTEIATALILTLAGGEASEVTVAGEVPGFDRVIGFRPARVESLGGIVVDPAAQDFDRLLKRRIAAVQDRLIRRRDGDTGPVDLDTGARFDLRENAPRLLDVFLIRNGDADDLIRNAQTTGPNAGRAQLSPRTFGDAFQVLANDLVDLDFEQQVRAALQIEAQVHLL